MQAIIYDIGKRWLMAQKNNANELFEKDYIGLRQKEERLCSDEELIQLPFVSRNNLHYKEWTIRQRSSTRLVHYLGKRKAPLKILEVGCGNGWLSHRLSAISGAFVTGIDINAFELHQAARVFAGVPGLQFIYGSLCSTELINRQFDIIVFAASVQYFRSLTGTIGQCMQMLKPGGEVHILDSHLYALNELGPAAERTAQYYSKLGFPAMANQYFHHCINELKPFDYKIMYQSSPWLRLFDRNNDPFPWISIKKKMRE